MIEIVSATRMTEDEFWQKSALGISLRRLAWDKDLVTWIAYENRTGLPALYNARIQAKNDHEYLVFIHDDVWLDDHYFTTRIREAGEKYDVFGVVGNRAPLPNQPGWAFSDWHPVKGWTDSPRDILSGSVGHGNSPFGFITHFGPSPLACELLDGLLLAARKKALVDSGTLFDPQFEFDFYDLDFCRSARANQLTLGTWPMAVTHQSVGGGFGTTNWVLHLMRYQSKWQAKNPGNSRP